MTKKKSNECYFFEVLILDPSGKSEILSPKSLVYGLMSTEKLWSNAKSIEKNDEFAIEDTDIELKIKPVDTSSTLYDLIEAGFLIKVKSSDFDKLERFRYMFVIHLRNRLSFEHIRILTDDISTEISNKAYPLINELENLLRRYISKFFTQKIGLDWWQKAVPDKVIEKTKMRTGNENVFSNIVQTDLTLIDFDDLGEIIYKHKLGFNRPQNLADSLADVTTLEELEKLKADLDSNYNRFFKENFKDKGFDKKWKQLFKVRNKVAHNNLFIKDDLESTIELHKELKEIILNAESKIDEFKFSVEEQVAIREKISDKVESNESLSSPKVLGKIDLSEYERDESDFFDIITEEEFFKELERAENSLRYNNLTYVGLKSFITKLLGSKGYAFGPSYALANILKEQEKVEIYDVDDPASYWPVKAIKKIK
ncbi:hypothetical protein GCM10022271_18900 [Corallibacter vietnamensis]|uniref:Apea-like HEPN domain-containing protein n=1 Tax=Corallibacter vietnamensis TaxID=904130 RepID=A0ABP7HAA0_9FLAO